MAEVKEKKAKKEKVPLTPKQKAKKAGKVIGIILAVIAGIALILGILWIITLSSEKKNAENLVINPNAAVDESKTLDRFHFINVDSGNAILLESNGHFAMFDAGEDTDNHPGKARVEHGYEQVVIDYLKKYAANENGKVHLDFIVATHAHSDHIGSFNEVLDDPDISCDTCYTKEYLYEEMMPEFEASWDNQECYDQLIEACKNNGTEIVYDLPTKQWQWQDFTLQFFNTEVIKKKNMDENCQSVVTKIIKTDTGKSALIVGDSNYMTPWATGNEWLVKDKVGQCDMLQLGHHGYAMSSFPTFLKSVNPTYAIACNTNRSKAYPDVRFSTAVVAKAALLVQGEENGLIADYTDEGDIEFYGHSCDGIRE